MESQERSRGKTKAPGQRIFRAAAAALAKAKDARALAAAGNDSWISTLVDAQTNIAEALWLVARSADDCAKQALDSLIASLTDRVRKIHSLPAHKVKAIAETMTEFPILASPRLASREHLIGQLTRFGVGSAIPNMAPKARWLQDDFAQAAQIIIEQLKASGLNAQSLAKRNWPVLRDHLRQYVFPEFLEDERYADLRSRLQGQVKGRKTAGGIKDRVKERLAERIHSMLGLKVNNLPDLPGQP